MHRNARTTALRRSLRATPIRGWLTWARHRGITSEDVAIASYPKSGNTWMKFLLAELATREPVDFQSAEKLVPIVGKHAAAPRVLPRGGRLLKTHEPYRSEYLRAIYLVRDVRDVVMSYYHFQRGFPGASHDLDSFVSRFVSGQVNAYDTWRDHVQTWLNSELRVERVTVVKYEDLRANAVEALAKVATFVGLDAESSRLVEVVQHNSVAAMREKEERTLQSPRKAPGFEGERHFVRGSLPGEWRDSLSKRHLEVMKPETDVAVSLGYPPD